MKKRGFVPLRKAFAVTGCLRIFLIIVLGVPAAIIATLFIGWWMHTASVRYRLTLVIEAGGREHRGSGVLEATCETTFWLFQGVGGESCRAKGEAIPVDLGTQGFLFVTLRGRRIRFDEVSSPAFLPWLAFPDAGDDAQGHRNYLTAIQALEGTSARTDLPLQDLPILVRFGNIADPKSVEQVEPEDLETPYGPGARIVSATLEITDDAITTGIEKLLPWVDTWRGALDGTPLGKFSHAASANLSSLDFKPGTNQ